MKPALLFSSFTVTYVAAFSFNTYDLGFHGLYPRQHFHSVNLQPPAPQISRWDSRCDSGSLLLTPRGPLVQGSARGPVILDPKGNLLWMNNKEFKQAMNLDVQTYKGKDYLTFWTKVKKAKKNGAKKSKKSYVMLNSAYEVVHRVVPVGKGLKADSHEFRVTPQGTALITIYFKHEADCTELGLGKKCWIKDGIFQEIDIETGKLVFEWRATDHISMNDVFSSPNWKDGHGRSKQDAFDYFHINSVDKLESGDFLISARYMHAVICVSGKTGEILWQLGGKNNNFKDLDSATDFAWQHHVRWLGNNTISLYNNYANNVFHRPSKHSDAMLIHLNTEDMTTSLIHRYIHPDKILSVSQGSVQVLPKSGNVLVGFGNSPTYVEYSASGDMLCNMRLAPHIVFELIDFGFVKSYRIFKKTWVGRPKTVPDVKVKGKKLYVSWNGATKVKSWRLEKAKMQDSKDEDFATVQEWEREGFETSFALDNVEGYVRVVALDKKRKAMASSEVVRITSPSHVFWWILFILLSFGGAFLLLHRFHFRVPLLRKFQSFRARYFSRAKVNRIYDSEFDSESSPLMLNDREFSR